LCLGGPSADRRQALEVAVRSLALAAGEASSFSSVTTAEGRHVADRGRRRRPAHEIRRPAGADHMTEGARPAESIDGHRAPQLHDDRIGAKDDVRCVLDLSFATGAVGARALEKERQIAAIADRRDLRTVIRA